MEAAEGMETVSVMSRNAPDSATAVLGEKEEDPVYTRAQVDACVRKDKHEQAPMPANWDGRLYSVTTIAPSARSGGTRTVAICRSFERACEIVETNEGDIWETSYQLVVIEALLPDALYGGSSHEQYWYRWHQPEHTEDPYESGKYEPIEVPYFYEHTLGFGIG